MIFRAFLFAMLAVVLFCGPTARAENCSSPVDCTCSPPERPGQQSIYLGHYQGLIALYDAAPNLGQRAAVRLECPQTDHCVCAFPIDFQIRNEKPESGRFRAAFTGSPSIGAFPDTSFGLGASADGRLLVDPKAFLAKYLRADGPRLVLRTRALRLVRIRLIDTPINWGIERWNTRTRVTAKASWTRVIVGVSNFLTLGLNGLDAGGALFAVDESGRVILDKVIGPVALRPASQNTIDIGGS